MWSRRELLAALGATGATVAMGGWLGGCAGPQRRSRTLATGEGLDDLLPQLLEIIDQKLSGAYVWSRQSKRHRVARDAAEQHFDLFQGEEVVVGGDGRSLAFRNASRQELLAKTRSFAAKLPSSVSGRSPLVLPEPEDLLESVSIDPASQPHEAFHRPVAELFQQSRSVGTSRIIYRSAYSLSDDEHVRFLSRTHNQRRRELRQRKGVLFAAWTGDEVSTSAAEHFGSGGLELPGPTASAIERASKDALAHVHARSAPSGAQDIILSPECAALVAMEAIAKPAFRRGAGPMQSPFLRVRNDPTYQQGYGSFLADAFGAAPSSLALFGERSAESIAKGNRRRDNELQVSAQPSNVIVEEGALAQQELVAEVAEGVYLDAPSHCSVDKDGQVMALVCGRGREIREGRFTGRLFSRLVCSARTAELFSNTRALGKESRAIAFEERGVAMSAQAPAWLSRAQVEAG